MRVPRKNCHTDKKVTTSERTHISWQAALDRAVCRPFGNEWPTWFAKATSLNRKPGERSRNSSLSCPVEQHSSSLLQCCSNGCEAGLQIRQALNDGRAALVVDHGSQQLALSHELLIVPDQDLERGRLLTIALGHTIVLR